MRLGSVQIMASKRSAYAAVVTELDMPSHCTHTRSIPYCADISEEPAHHLPSHHYHN